ncbi:MAG: bifunctional 4-hydroxy-3-methylbut-2-enyl diphosphate reductase/30S ribosomal protein S1 [Oscillospiraceae bacterium]|nr:bifunctional 4-hydroxy-3-methylbut-2-enyl diphosphate reductase/30S ribosomal protein S1 [Oscillospiraceae bacterium]MDD5921412.1 bifunctional 4-hydroxy-3-methylbut-2-enyl diphosphate reductase/30S ribosomal protein S1 [Oscillospiraceae bacterium]
MRIKIAKTAGFCFGVDRAVKMAFDTAENSPNAVTLGPIIHNPQIVSRLESMGVRSVSSPEEILPDTTVVIRSHGVGQPVYDYLCEHHIPFVDATCPFVAKIHQIVKEYSEKGYLILIAGDKTHPEVEGIVGFCRSGAVAFNREEELRKMTEKNPEWTSRPAILVAQTTFNIQEWRKSAFFAKKVYTNLIIFDTICNATEMRQQEAIVLAKESDVMVVIGGKNSSNTMKLAEICSQYCQTFHIEKASELPRLDLSTSSVIGVTAGASTPACIIKEVQETMSEFITNDELSFGEMLDQSFKSTYNGKKETGVVVGITPTEVQVDIGTKHTGYVPLSELTDDPNAKIEDLVKVGDEIELLVVRVNDVEGTVVLSKKRLDAIAGMMKVQEAAESGEILEGNVIEAVKGGVIVSTNGVRVFVPASQASLSRVENLEELVKQHVSLKILECKEIGRGRKRIIGSMKAVLKEQRKVQEEEFWKTVEVGKKYTGAVKSLTSYGAFVDLGGVDGMIHISELSWNRIKHPSEVVNVGDVLEVYVKDIDTEKHKISLGYKNEKDNPWEILKNEYPVGTVTKVKIVSITTFGAFAQIIPGIDGLIHISQISSERVNKVSDVLNVGDEVDAKITEIDFEKKRVSLSMRAVNENAPEPEEAE